MEFVLTEVLMFSSEVDIHGFKKYLIFEVFNGEVVA